MEPEVKQGLEIVADLAEAGLDRAFADGLLRDLPVIGTAYKLAALGRSISDRIFVTKLARFLRSLQDIPNEQIEAFCRRVDDGGIGLRRLGEALVLAINRIDDMDKLPILGLVFRAYLSGAITYDQFRRIYAAIDSAVLTDLLEFCDAAAKSDGPSFSHLLNSGLTSVGTNGIDEMGRVVFLGIKKTELGELFQQIMSQSRK